LGEGRSNINLRYADLDRVLADGVTGLLEIRHAGHRVWDFWENERERTNLRRIEDNGSMAGDPAAVSNTARKRGKDQLGTLGGGNHFIEFQVITQISDRKIAERFGLFEGQFVVMIHSGSRGLGHQVGSEYMKWSKKRHGGEAPVAWLDLDEKPGRDYIGAMHAAANFAFANRHLMGALVTGNILRDYPDARVRLLYDVPHNIAKFEEHGGRTLLVHRKGATRSFGPRRMAGTSFADTGQPVLIPGSMGTASYILAGADTNRDNLASVNHGAGRVMSRTEARGKRRGGKVVKQAAITEEDFERAMEGILLLTDNRRAVRDEAPQAYKNIDTVMETVLGAGLAVNVARTRPLAVMKG
jgi:tRNA-splicing ligase RtcB (3'-phosphate/5'-hydroxy nucleic acid ligase)